MKNSDTCPACGSVEASEFCVSTNSDYSVAGHRYVTCGGCGSIFLADKVGQAWLTQMHVDHWLSQGGFQWVPERSLEDRSAALQRQYSKIVPPPEAGDLWLDVGSGRGELCAAAIGLGFHVVGIEPADDAVATARDFVPQATFYLSGAEDIGQLRGQIVDARVITLSDVLEHLSRPGDVLRECRQVLAPGGMCVVHVPAAESLQIELLKEHSMHLMGPFHRTLFSARGLAAIAKSAGFGVVEFLPVPPPWGWTRGLSWQLGSQDDYAEWRRSPKFREFDLAVENLLNRMASMMGRHGAHMVRLRT